MSEIHRRGLVPCVRHSALWVASHHKRTSYAWTEWRTEGINSLSQSREEKNDY
jgi:hypothetical protein